MSNRKSIVITGGTGFIGSHLTELMVKEGYKVTVFDRYNPNNDWGWLEQSECKNDCNIILGDIRDYDKLKGHLDWADVVVWLAALVGDPACALSKSLTKEINNDPVRFLSTNYNGKIIYMSSCSVYGTGEDILTEKSKLNPLSLYAESKIEDEKTLAGSNTICFRLGTLYGISDNFSRIRFDLVVNTLVMRAIFHNKVVYFHDQFPWVYNQSLHLLDQ